MGQVCTHLFISFVLITNIIVSLCARYRGFAQRLIQTGGGLQNDETEEQVVQYKVPGDGPNPETSSDAQNLWGEFSHILYLRKSLNSIFERPNCA